MKFLVTGSMGQVGWELLNALPRSNEIIGLDRAQLDLADMPAIRRMIRDIKPNLIINAAAFTQVDRAETESELAAKVNAEALGVIGEEATRLGAAVIHYSTDYIFDGKKTTPYTPDDRPNPQSEYGRSKLGGEIALRQSGASFVILRTAWVYGLRGHNFLLTMLRLASERSELRVVNDQIGAPTWSASIANATAAIVAKALTSRFGAMSFGGLEGTYHLTSGGRTSWFGFAQRILDLADGPRKPSLNPITSAEYNAPAHRPAFSVLDCSNTYKTFGVQIADWAAVLNDVMLIRNRQAQHESR